MKPDLFIRLASLYAVPFTGPLSPRAGVFKLALLDLKEENTMVYLALTPRGLREILADPAAAMHPIWCSADALSEAEFSTLRCGNVTRFNYSLANADTATIASAMATIEEHHPGERIWVENAGISE